MPLIRFTRPHRNVGHLLFIFFVLASPWGWAQDDDRKKFEEVKKQIEALKAELEETKGSRAELHKSLEENEKSISELNEKAKKLESELKKGQKDLQELRDERGELIQKKNRESKIVSQYLSSAYQLGKQGQIRLLLNQQSPAEVSRMLRYYERFSDERAAKIASFRTTINRLNDIEPQIEQQTASLQRTFDELKVQQAKLKNSQAQRKQVLVKLNTELKGQESQIAALVKDRKRLQTLLNRVNEAISDQELALKVTEFSKLKGQLPWPTRGKVLHKYGSSRMGGTMKWQGLHIGATNGADVLAVHHGQVVFSDYLRGHGLLIIVDHGAGYMSLYAHNQYLYKETGAWVEAGEKIAAVGDTGGQSETALYFELRHRGKPTNPQVWLQPT